MGLAGLGLRARAPRRTFALSTLPPPGDGDTPARPTPPSAPSPDAPATDELPRRFGSYELRALLGRGGMGEVYRAYDTARRRDVAVKLLSGTLAGDASFRARFERESQIAARLADPHIIPIHDFGEIDGRLFLDMRLVDGHDLAAYLKQRGRLPVHVALDIVEQIASALDAAHRHGLVHRDVKPSNVLLTGVPGGRPFAYLVDFGIARPMAEDGSAVTTSSGTFGTVAYLAPERIRGEAGDPRTDVYALGCVLFELLTGRRPWDGDIYAVLSGHVTAPPPSLAPELPGCPPGLDAAVRRAMAKRPDDRYPTAGAFAEAAAAAVRAAVTGPAYGGPPVPRTHPGAPLPPQPPPARAATPSPARPPGPPAWHGADPVRGGPPPKSRRRLVIAAVLASAVLVGGVAVGLSLTRGSDRPTGAPPAGSQPAATGSSTASGLLPGGSGSTVSWQDFASFSTIVGTKNGDTAHSFEKLPCTLRKSTFDLPDGVVEQVRCSRTGGDDLGLGVFRFRTTADLQAALRFYLEKYGYAAKPWGADGTAFGLRLTSPETMTGSSILTSVCSLPNYLVSLDSVGLNAVELRSYWDRMVLPDRRPGACNDAASAPAGPVGGTNTASKQDVPIGSVQQRALLSRFSGPGPLATGSVGSTLEFMVVANKSRVEFWEQTDAGLRYTGFDNYPSIGSRPYSVLDSAAPARPLPGMKHLTYILYGPFLPDTPNAAVVYSRSTEAGDAWQPLGVDAKNRLRFDAPVATTFKYAYFSTSQQLSTTTSSDKTTMWTWDGTGFRAG